jgi:hypothetical protein
MTRQDRDLATRQGKNRPTDTTELSFGELETVSGGSRKAARQPPEFVTFKLSTFAGGTSTE